MPETLFIPKEQFVRTLGDWTVERFVIDGELAFAALSKGPEFHFQSFGTGHPITPTMIREYLRKIIDEYGYAKTATPKEDVRQHRFNLRFGFTVTGEDEYDVHYRIERLRHA